MTVDVPVVAPSFYDELARDEDDALTEQMLINPNAKLQVTELDHATPLFKISDNASAAADPESVAFSNLSAVDGQIYRTAWSRLLGTELIFDDYGELVGTVREHLVADSLVKVKSKPDAKDAVEPEPLEEADSRTAFLKRALAAARAKEMTRE